MGVVCLYRFCLYDVRDDQLIVSKRWGTREAIARIGGRILEETLVEADEDLIDSDIEGMTAIGFTPPCMPLAVAG